MVRMCEATRQPTIILERFYCVRAVPTRPVAKVAGVPAPTIFWKFGDKDGLMGAVAEHVMAT